MAFVSIMRRYGLPVLLSTALVTCSTDALVPPGSVDRGAKVGSISPPRRQAPADIPSAASEQAYPASGQPLQQSADYMNTADLSSGGQSTGMPSMTSDQASAGARGVAGQFGGQPANWGGTQPLAVPAEGVNMDAELGAEPVTGLAEEQQQQIAEGQSDQPVVDGIGTDNPTELNRARPPRAQSQPTAGQEQIWNDARTAATPSRLPEESEPRDVAMLRPNDPMASEPRMSQPAVPDVMPSSELSCRRELKRLGVIFTDKPPISNGAACQVPYPISLQGLSGNIGVRPAATLNCQVTLAFAKWVKNELAPSARYRYWSGIKTIEPLGGYSCRRMNNSRQKYNPMSEHSRANAIDVGKFVLKSGQEIDVRKKGLFSFREGRLLQAVRTDSCKYFNTVLGPGSNAEHWNHFHFDLRERKSGKIYCD